MIINNLFSIKKLRNSEFFKDVFDIQSFVIVFTMFSLISIWSSDQVYNKTKEINELNKEIQYLKVEYVSTRTMLMTQSKRSVLLKKADSFGLFQSDHPIKTIYLE